MMHSAFQDSWFCGPGGFFSHWPLGGVWHLVVWGIVLFLAYKLITALVSGNRAGDVAAGHEPASLAILEKRYASGDIDREEFLRKKEDLTR